MIGWLHGSVVSPRRSRVLVRHLASLLPQGASVLDVGCGDGRLAAGVTRERPDVSICGVDVLVRTKTAIPVARFDGSRIPLRDGAVDVVLLVDVLHHTDDAVRLLTEASRVARQLVIVKDHCAESTWDHATLRMMDWVGNARYGVSLPYSYFSRQEWVRAFRAGRLNEVHYDDELGLYPMPASAVFERTLHFMCALQPDARVRMGMGGLART